MTGVRVVPGMLVGAAVGIGIVVLSGAGPAAWRAPVVGAAAGLLVGGLRRLIAVARLEWRRQAPTGRTYLAAVVPVVVALLLAGVATT